MSTLEHRLQILVSAEQKARLDKVSAETGRSVGALVREAVDQRYLDEQRQRAVAIDYLLARSAAAESEEPAMDWPDIKAEILRSVDERVP